MYPFRMKKIKLTHNQYAIVDNIDFQKLGFYKWGAKWNTPTKSYYAVRTVYEGGKRDVRMHREIMQVPKGLIVDHINHDTLDNRRSNLRICTYSQNNFNIRLRKDNSSGLRGVSKMGDRWFAQIQHQGKKFHIGTFGSKEEASKAYQKRARELFKEFASI